VLIRDQFGRLHRTPDSRVVGAGPQIGYVSPGYQGFGDAVGFPPLLAFLPKIIPVVAKALPAIASALPAITSVFRGGAPVPPAPPSLPGPTIVPAAPAPASYLTPSAMPGPVPAAPLPYAYPRPMVIYQSQPRRRRVIRVYRRARPVESEVAPPSPPPAPASVGPTMPPPGSAPPPPAPATAPPSLSQPSGGAQGWGLGWAGKYGGRGFCPRCGGIHGYGCGG
jgi:hypothetical protein